MLWTASQVLRKFSTSSVSNAANNHRDLMRELLWCCVKCVCSAECVQRCAGQHWAGSGLTAVILSKSLSCCIFSQHGRRWSHFATLRCQRLFLPLHARTELAATVQYLEELHHHHRRLTVYWLEPGLLTTLLGWKRQHQTGSFISYLPCRWEVAVQQQPACQMCTWQDLACVHGKPETSMLNTCGGGSGVHLSLLRKGRNLHQPIAFLSAAFSQ